MYSLNHNICFALSLEHVRGQREIWLLEVKFLSCGLVHGCLAVRRGAALEKRALYRQLLAQHRLHLMVLGQRSTRKRWRTRASSKAQLVMCIAGNLTTGESVMALWRHAPCNPNVESASHHRPRYIGPIHQIWLRLLQPTVNCASRVMWARSPQTSAPQPPGN